MDSITFDRLLLKTAFCCMACDGHIDHREIEVIKSLCSESPLFANFDFAREINQLVIKINADGQGFIKRYFSLLHETPLTEEEELALMDFAIKTIHADDVVEYAEVKFLKAIRSRLNVSTDRILAHHPEMEYHLEDDIVSESYMDVLVNQYFDSVALPEFAEIQI